MKVPLAADLLLAWRHPRPDGAEGRCIGAGTDLPVDRRRAKRLARRIQHAARRHGLPRVVVTSPLQRCADVGRWLRRWGWQHRIDPALAELHFGGWEGRRWDQIERRELDAWCADFCGDRPGGGESLDAMLGRVRSWQSIDARVVVSHAGWLVARRWCEEQDQEGPSPTAEAWPRAPAYGSLYLVRMSLPVPVRRSR
jgi:alpha-ribazole phosphatase